MKKSIFYVSAFLFGVSANAQHELSVTVNSGLGKIEVVKPETAFTLTETESFYKPTFGLDINYSYSFKFLSLETGLNYNHIIGSHSEFFNLSNSDGYNTRVKAITDHKAHYLNVPILINFKYKKFIIGGGASVGFRITNSKLTQIYYDDIRNAIYGGGNDLNKIDFGINAQFGFAINERFTIQAKLYKGLTDISNGYEKGLLYTLFEGEPLDRELKNQQIMLGLKIKLGKINGAAQVTQPTL